MVVFLVNAGQGAEFCVGHMAWDQKRVSHLGEVDSQLMGHLPTCICVKVSRNVYKNLFSRRPLGGETGGVVWRRALIFSSYPFRSLAFLI